jgi:hypothetical protein
MTSRYLEKQCPACGYTIAKVIFDAGVKPLAMIAWAESEEEAKSVQSFNQEYIQCLGCSHVWNHLFDWEHVPYGNKPNKMYNDGAQWKNHIEGLQHWLSDRIPNNPTVIDIGCGDGNFLISMAKQYGNSGIFLGFDPGGDVDPKQSAINFKRTLFSPIEDTAKYTPDLIVMRHVIEHLSAPSSFLHALAWGASDYEKPTYLYCEVPCIDRVFKTGRLADFYYEHPSQFTSLSFSRMLSTAGQNVDVHHSYDGEVICGLVELSPSSEQSEISKGADLYFSTTPSSIKQITHQLNDLVKSGKSLAVWGGTGKCAAFMHHYNVSSDDIPTVVDSDERKWCTYVPGVGQEIRSPSHLLEKPVDILIIPAQWRAGDILLEAEERGLKFDQVLIEHNGALIDFRDGDHPYSRIKL